MDRKQLIVSYQDEVNNLRSQLLRLEVDSVEQRASDEVHKWQQSFDTSSSSKEVEHVLNEIEKRKQAEVSQLGNELRVSLAAFKKNHLSRLAELDKFISLINLDDDLRLDLVKFELDSAASVLRSLHVDIVVRVVHNSMQRRLSTPFTRQDLELVKVFEFKEPEPESSLFADGCESVRNFVRRASGFGAGYYNVDLPGQTKHF